MKSATLLMLISLLSLASSVMAAKPEFTNCPTSPITFSHCDTFFYDFDAVNPAGGAVIYELVAGPGNIAPLSGEWTWGTVGEESSNNLLLLVIRATDGTESSVCSTAIEVTDKRPKITNGCGAIDSTYPEELQYQLIEFSNDCGYSSLSIDPVNGTFAGHYSVSMFGYINVVPALSDQNLQQPVKFRVRLSDSFGVTDSCDYSVYVRQTPALRVSMNNVVTSWIDTSLVFQVAIQLSSIREIDELGGFEFTISYPTEDISLTSVAAGELFDSCHWEYFHSDTYKSEPCEQCGDSVVRIAGVKTVNQPPEFQCTNPGTDPVTIATLTFTSKYFDCRESWTGFPIKFYWDDCSRNMLSSENGATLNLCAAVFDAYPGSTHVFDVTDTTSSFPSVHGPTSECLQATIPGQVSNREVLFYNTVLPVPDFFNDCINPVGDLNLNGFSFELADLVIYTDVVRQGLSALPFMPDPRTLRYMGDINNDDIPFTPADLVMMIRYMLGDYPVDEIVPAGVLDVGPEGGK